MMYVSKESGKWKSEPKNLGQMIHFATETIRYPSSVRFANLSLLKEKKSCAYFDNPAAGYKVDLLLIIWKRITDGTVGRSTPT